MCLMNACQFCRESVAGHEEVAGARGQPVLVGSGPGALRCAKKGRNTCGQLKEMLSERIAGPHHHVPLRLLLFRHLPEWSSSPELHIKRRQQTPARALKRP